VKRASGNASLALSENVTISTNALNTTQAQQAITVTGTESLPLAVLPIFSSVAGTYTSPQKVTFSDTTPGAAIYYTTDGTVPTGHSTRYGGVITIAESQTIQAVAAASGYDDSPVASATYTVNLPPDFSLGVTPAQLTLKSRQSGTVTLSVTPQNGFASVVSFVCSGLPSGASCSFSPTAVTPSGGTVTTTLSFSASAAVSAVRSDSRPSFPAISFAVAICLLGFGRRRRVQLLSMLVAGALGLGLLARMRWNVTGHFDSYGNSQVRLSAAHCHNYFDDAMSQPNAGAGALAALFQDGPSLTHTSPVPWSCLPSNSFSRSHANLYGPSGERQSHGDPSCPPAARS
jgi:Chitobiase/beta-hexosaminidase C-terminal domain